MFKLRNRIAFYIPSTDDSDSKIPDSQHDERSNYIASFFARLFGGSTILNNVTGNWINSDGKLVGESIKIVYSFCSSEDLEDHYSDVIQTAVKHCEYWSQASIAIEINDDLILIDSSD